MDTLKPQTTGMGTGAIHAGFAQAKLIMGTEFILSVVFIGAKRAFQLLGKLRSSLAHRRGLVEQLGA